MTLDRRSALSLLGGVTAATALRPPSVAAQTPEPGLYRTERPYPIANGDTLAVRYGSGTDVLGVYDSYDFNGNIMRRSRYGLRGEEAPPIVQTIQSNIISL